MTDALAQPYPERIRELENKLAIWRVVSSERMLRIKELERLLDSTRQQYVDADHMLRIRDTECRQLRVEVGTLRFEATQMMAENAGLIQANDALKRDKAELHERLDRQAGTFKNLLDIGRKQAARIRELEAEVERLKGQNGWRGPDWRGPARGEPTVEQFDLPPTRAEERTLMDEVKELRAITARGRAEANRNESDAMASLANTLAGIDNEERD